MGHTNESGLHALAPSPMLCLTRLISRPPYVLRVPAVQQTRCTMNGAHEESLLELDVVRLVLQSGLGCACPSGTPSANVHDEGIFYPYSIAEEGGWRGSTSAPYASSPAKSACFAFSAKES